MGKLLKANRYILHFYWKFVILSIICCSTISRSSSQLWLKQWPWGLFVRLWLFSIHWAKMICAWVGWGLWQEGIIVLPIVLVSALTFFGTSRSTTLNEILMCHYSSQMPQWLLVHNKSQSSGFCCLPSSCFLPTLMYTVF